MDLKHFLASYLFRNGYSIPIAVASQPANNFSNLFGIDIGYINNGVRITDYDSSIPLKDRQIDYLCIGRFVPVKNHLFLLKIIDSHYKNSSYRFVFLGDGPLLEQCKKFARSHELKNVVFKGFVDNCNMYLSNSKILLMPSLNEGNPMVINEALASGMIVVGSDVGGIHDLLIYKDNGFLCKVNNENSFVDSMKNAMVLVNQGYKSKNVCYETVSIRQTITFYMDLFERS